MSKTFIEIQKENQLLLAEITKLQNNNADYSNLLDTLYFNYELLNNHLENTDVFEERDLIIKEMVIIEENYLYVNNEYYLPLDQLEEQIVSSMKKLDDVIEYIWEERELYEEDIIPLANHYVKLNNYLKVAGNKFPHLIATYERLHLRVPKFFFERDTQKMFYEHLFNNNVTLNPTRLVNFDNSKDIPALYKKAYVDELISRLTDYVLRLKDIDKARETLYADKFISENLKDQILTELLYYVDLETINGQSIFMTMELKKAVENMDKDLYDKYVLKIQEVIQNLKQLLPSAPSNNFQNETEKSIVFLENVLMKNKL